MLRLTDLCRMKNQHRGMMFDNQCEVRNHHDEGLLKTATNTGL
jgi:hypothetical protein